MLLKSDFGAGQVGERNVQNAVEELNIFDTDWFYDSGRDEDYQYYELFIENFADWLRANGEDIDEYRNKPFDAEYYFKEYMEDDKADHTGIEKLYEAVEDWVKTEDDFVNSLEYAHGMYAYESGATDIEFYTDDVEDNARKLFKEQRYTENDILHGFSRPEDLVNAVFRAIDKGGLKDVDEYDGGSYGTHSFDGTEDYFETGCLFLGNSELEYQMETSVPFSAENDYSEEVGCHSPYNWYGVSTRHPDLIYATPTWIFVYGVPWEAVEEAGDELGVRK